LHAARDCEGRYSLTVVLQLARGKVPSRLPWLANCPSYGGARDSQLKPLRDLADEVLRAGLLVEEGRKLKGGYAFSAVFLSAAGRAWLAAGDTARFSYAVAAPRAHLPPAAGGAAA